MKEKTRHRLAFDLYVRMGANRNLQALHEALEDDPSVIGLSLTPSRSSLETWSSQFHWQDRLLDLERQATDRDREEQIRELSEMNERHAREGLALQQKAVERLNSLGPMEFSSSDAVRALVEGVRLERLARGEPTDRVKQESEVLYGHIDLGNFSNEELRRLVELAERRAAGTGKEKP